MDDLDIVSLSTEEVTAITNIELHVKVFKGYIISPNISSNRVG